MSSVAEHPDTRNPFCRYEEDGAAYIDLGTDLLDSPCLPLVRLALTEGLPPDSFDFDPFGECVWVRFDVARDVERRLRRMAPGVESMAEANPDYRGGTVAR